MSPALSRNFINGLALRCFPVPSADGRPPSGGIYENLLSFVGFKVYRRSAFE